MTRMIRMPMLLVIAVVWAHTARAAAQERPALQPGERVRVTSRSHQLERSVASVLSARTDTVTLSLAIGADTLVLPVEVVDTLEVWREHPLSERGRRKGMLIGAGIGVAISAIGMNVLDNPVALATPPVLLGGAGAILGAGGCSGGRIGACLMGTAAGVLLGAALGSTACGDEGCDGATAVAGALVLAVPGALIGGLIGMATPGASWQRIELPPPSPPAPVQSSIVSPS